MTKSQVDDNEFQGKGLNYFMGRIITLGQTYCIDRYDEEGEACQTECQHFLKKAIAIREQIALFSFVKKSIICG